MKHVAWTHIESLHNIVRMLEARMEYHEANDMEPYRAPTVVYRAKVKLHGTNAGVRIDDDEVVAQGRNRLITPKEDNCGFAAWVEANREYFVALGARWGSAGPLTIFGEWCGPGIQKGTAINQIPQKVFAVFAMQLGDDESPSIIVVTNAAKDWYMAKARAL